MKCPPATLLAALLSFVAPLLTTTGARAEAPRHAAMVIDGNTGKTLYEASADAPRPPASLTKMMTLYLVFEEMRLGHLRYETRIRISEAAASVAPSKLGLDPGEDILLIDAIKALIIKSANDMAVAVAEHIAGSEKAFAQRMTLRARQIGMQATTFRNASGLPDTAQLTTARDMLTLALRLYDDFPDQARLFSLRSFTYRGKTHRTHNTLMHSFEGLDGIKTGYTRASGFNVVTSVHTHGLYLVGAVFGGSSAASRNSQMRFLLRRAMVDASRERTRRSDPMLVAAPAPEARAAKDAVVKAKAIQEKPKPAIKTAAAPDGAKQALVPRPEAAAIDSDSKAEHPQVASKLQTESSGQNAPGADTPIEIVSVRPVLIDNGGADEQRAEPQARQDAEALGSKRAALTAEALPKLDFEALKRAADGRHAGAGREGAVQNETAEEAARARAPRPNRKAAPAQFAPPGTKETIAAKHAKGTAGGAGRPPSTLNEQLALLSEDAPPAQSAIKTSAAGSDRIAAPGRPPSTLEAQVAQLGYTERGPAPRKAPAWRLRGPDLEAAAAGGGSASAPDYEVEIGVFATAEEAERRLEAAKGQTSALAQITGLALPLKVGKRLFYRATFTSLDESDAAAACNALRQRSIDCQVKGPQ